VRIIDRDIQAYSTFAETSRDKVRRCVPQAEEHYKKQAKLEENVVKALQELKTFLDTE